MTPAMLLSKSRLEPGGDEPNWVIHDLTGSYIAK
jgi:hypothetical protein